MTHDDGRRPPGDALSMWTVYDHPTDFPNSYIAREWIIGRGPAAIVITDNIIVSGKLETIRDKLMAKGLVRMPRERDDDPKILEVWL